MTRAPYGSVTGWPSQRLVAASKACRCHGKVVRAGDVLNDAVANAVGEVSLGRCDQLPQCATQSVKLVRNAFAVFCVECGTVRFRASRRHEVAQRRHTLWPAATGRIGPAPLGSAEMPVRPSRLLAVESQATPQIRIHADPSAAVHAVGLVRAGNETISPMRASTKFLRPSIRLLRRRWERLAIDINLTV